MGTLASLMVSLGLKNNASAGAQRAARDFEQLEDTVTQTDKAFAGLGDSMKTAGKAAGVGAGVALAAGMAEGLNVDAANDKLSAQLALTESESARIGGVAGDLFRDAYGGSLEEVNTAIKGVVQNIGGMATASDAELQKVTGSVLDLATGMEQDIGGVTRAVGQMIKTGLADNATEALDIITAGFTKGVDKAEDFLDTLNEYGTQFRKLGLDGATATGLISQGLQAGARDADIVADAFKEFSIRAIDGSEASAAGFEALGLNAEKMTATFAKGGPKAAGALDQVLDRLRGMKNPVDQSAAAVALFGTQAEDLGAALFSLDPSAAVGALGEVSGAAEKFGTTLNDNAQTKIETYRRAITGFVTDLATLPGPFGAVGAAAIAIGPSMLSTLGPLGSMVAAQRAAAAAATMSAAQQAAAGAVAKASMLSTAATAVASTARMVGAWALLGAQSLLHAAKVAAAWFIALGPIGWVIAAVIAVVALIIANWDTVVSWTKKAWQWVSDAVSGAIDWVVGFVKRNWKLLISIILGPLGIIIALVASNWDRIKAFFRAGVNTALAIFGWFARLPGRIREWFGQVKTWIVRKFTEAVAWVKGIPGRIRNALGNLGGLLLGAGKAIIDGLLNGLRNAVGAVWDFVSGIGDKIASLKGPLPYDRKLLIPAGQAIMDGLLGGLEDGFGDVLGLVSGMAGQIGSEFGSPELSVGANADWAGAGMPRVPAGHRVPSGGQGEYHFHFPHYVGTPADLVAAIRKADRELGGRVLKAKR